MAGLLLWLHQPESYSSITLFLLPPAPQFIHLRVPTFTALCSTFYATTLTSLPPQDSTGLKGLLLSTLSCKTPSCFPLALSSPLPNRLSVSVYMPPMLPPKVIPSLSFPPDHWAVNNPGCHMLCCLKARPIQNAFFYAGQPASPTAIPTSATTTPQFSRSS